jgi:hypothetical protein
VRARSGDGIPRLRMSSLITNLDAATGVASPFQELSWAARTSAVSSTSSSPFSSESPSSIASKAYRAVIVNWSPLYISMASSYTMSGSWDFSRHLDHQRAIQVRLLGYIPDGHGSEQDDTVYGVRRNASALLAEPVQSRRDLGTPKWTPDRRGGTSAS